MMKGITPIISIIILLLITIGLASAAWTYMSGYMTGLMAKNLEVLTPSSCINGVQAAALIRNIGTSRISVTDIQAMNTDTGSAMILTWSDLSGGTLLNNAIDSQTSARVRITNSNGSNCTTAGTTKTCHYELTVSGSNWKQDIAVYCSG